VPVFPAVSVARIRKVYDPPPRSEYTAEPVHRWKLSMILDPLTRAQLLTVPAAAGNLNLATGLLVGFGG
jgi:hypothetical protein